MGESLIDFAMTISNRGRGAWHYLSPVSSTFVLESPQSDGCILVEVEDLRVLDVLLYPPKNTDEEFDRVVRELTSRFTLEAQNP